MSITVGYTLWKSANAFAVFLGILTVGSLTVYRPRVVSLMGLYVSQSPLHHGPRYSLSGCHHFDSQSLSGGCSVIVADGSFPPVASTMTSSHSTISVLPDLVGLASASAPVLLAFCSPTPASSLLASPPPTSISLPLPSSACEDEDEDGDEDEGEDEDEDEDEDEGGDETSVDVCEDEDEGETSVDVREDEDKDEDETSVDVREDEDEDEDETSVDVC